MSLQWGTLPDAASRPLGEEFGKYSRGTTSSLATTIAQFGLFKSSACHFPILRIHYIANGQLQSRPDAMNEDSY